MACWKNFDQNILFSFFESRQLWQKFIWIVLVGEPINEEAWHWYYDVVGQKRCPIADTWWQTGDYHLFQNISVFEASKLYLCVIYDIVCSKNSVRWHYLTLTLPYHPVLVFRLLTLSLHLGLATPGSLWSYQLSLFMS